ncbi:MAG: GNAT family N-acetyltransferase [Sphingomonas sp.]
MSAGDGLTLRRAVAADAARLALLGGATFLQSFAHDHPGDALVDHAAIANAPGWYARALADPGNALWIVETALEAPIGYAMLAPPAVAEPGTLELKRIYMLAGWQGGGWGVRLLHAVEAEARTRGATRLMLGVYEPNTGARRFYERHGFHPTGASQRFMVGAWESVDLVYAKPF